jgi:hypothetical protein
MNVKTLRNGTLALVLFAVAATPAVTAGEVNFCVTGDTACVCVMQISDPYQDCGPTGGESGNCTASAGLDRSSQAEIVCPGGGGAACGVEPNGCVCVANGCRDDPTGRECLMSVGSRGDMRGVIC